MRYSFVVLAALFSFAVVGGGCTSSPSVSSDASTVAMADTLAAIAVEARTHPMDYFHLNRVRAESVQVQLEQAAPEAKRQLRLNYANALLTDMGTPPIGPRIAAWH